MSKPQSLRNIPPDAMRYAEQISARTGLSMSDVFRLALLSRCLVELTKVSPDPDGNYGGMDAQVLARTLRRHLASAIDFLLEHNQHPYQNTLRGELETRASSPSPSLRTPEQGVVARAAFDQALGDDLELLGMGYGVSEIAEDQTENTRST